MFFFQEPSDRNDYTTKLNNLVKQAVTAFQKFIDSFNEHKLVNSYFINFLS